MKRYRSKPVKPFKFIYPNKDDSVLVELRHITQINFDDRTSDIDKAKAVIAYAHNLFDHDGDNEPSAYDPVTIINEAKQGKSFRCVEYSLLAVGLLWAYDIPARLVGLKTVDVETREYGAGHVVIEFWSHERQKWIMSDVQRGVIPQESGRYLSALELSQALDDNRRVTFEVMEVRKLSPEKTAKYAEWVKEYLYFIDTPIEITFESIDLKAQQIAMLVPLDVQPPVRFQNMFDMNVIYTNSEADFYVPPRAELR